MQTYLQSSTVRLEEMRVKRRDAEQWMSHRLLPEHLRERIRKYEHYKWQETRGADEEHLLQNLPKDLKRDIKRHLCLALVTRVSHLSKNLLHWNPVIISILRSCIYNLMEYSDFLRPTFKKMDDLI